MAPLIWGQRETRDQMLWYTLILLGVTVLPVAFGAFGVIYLAAALVLGAILLRGVLQVRSSESWTAPAWTTYKYSLLYLALLFAAMVIDRRVLL